MTMKAEDFQVKIDSANTGQYIDELRHTVSVASLNYDVWWALKNEANRTQYTETMNRYANFFTTGINAHFVALLIPLYRLYENKADTYNIPKLLDYLKHNGHLSPTIINELDRLKAVSAPLWEKIKILRNRAFGHRSRAHTTSELFKEANVTPDNLKELIAISKKLLNTISDACQNDVHAFNADATKDTEQLLGDLKKANASKP